jgi:hypothetical protein
MKTKRCSDWYFNRRQEQKTLYALDFSTLYGLERVGSSEMYRGNTLLFGNPTGIRTRKTRQIYKYKLYIQIGRFLTKIYLLDVQYQS